MTPNRLEAYAKRRRTASNAARRYLGFSTDREEQEAIEHLRQGIREFRSLLEERWLRL